MYLIYLCIQSDQGSNFTFILSLKDVWKLRFHQIMKFVIKAYCLEFARDWDEGIHIVLFAAREAVQESLGFSPFELVFAVTMFVVH